MKRLLIALLVAAAVSAGCASPKPTAAPSTPSASSSGAAPSAPSAPAVQAKTVVNIKAADLLKRLQSGEKPLIIDVREPQEFQEGHIAGARLMPLGSVEKAIVAAGIAKDQEVILICRSGNRSLQAYEKLSAIGYTKLVNVTGGMNEWIKVGSITK